VYHPTTSVLGISFTGGAAGGSAAANALPFTGLPLDILSAVMAALLAIGVGVTLVRLARLGTGERALRAPRFSE
jgi:hypothetical protein